MNGSYTLSRRQQGFESPWGRHRNQALISFNHRLTDAVGNFWVKLAANLPFPAAICFMIESCSTKSPSQHAFSYHTAPP